MCFHFRFELVQCVSLYATVDRYTVVHRVREKREKEKASRRLAHTPFMKLLGSVGRSVGPRSSIAVSV